MIIIVIISIIYIYLSTTICVHRQLAYYNCGDSANFDVIILSYSLLAYWDTSNSLFLSSFSKGTLYHTGYAILCYVMMSHTLCVCHAISSTSIQIS